MSLHHQAFAALMIVSSIGFFACVYWLIGDRRDRDDNLPELREFDVLQDRERPRRSM